MILGDALLLPEFIDSHLITCKSGQFLNIFPHSYSVKSNEPLFNDTKVAFIRVINLSRNALTINGLMADGELYRQLLNIQPNIISFNVGLSDMMLENVSWHKTQIPGEYIKLFQNLIISFHTYFTTQGRRGAFCDKLIYTFNMMPVYAACDGASQRRMNWDQVRQHENLWGTAWYLIERPFYKVCSDDINRRLHNGNKLCLKNIR